MAANKLTPQDGATGRGIITREWTFWCGLCSHWHQVGTENTLREAIIVAKRYGWRKTKAYGWICSTHPAL